MAIEGISVPDTRLAVDGANTACGFLRKHGVSQQDLDTVWTAIALHTTPGIPKHMHPVVALVTAGVEMDVLGLSYARNQGQMAANRDEHNGVPRATRPCWAGSSLAGAACRWPATGWDRHGQSGAAASRVSPARSGPRTGQPHGPGAVDTPPTTGCGGESCAAAWPPGAVSRAESCR